jgi:hypothetical protein
MMVFVLLRLLLRILRPRRLPESKSQSPLIRVTFYRVTVTKPSFTPKSGHKMSQNSANPSGLQEAEMKNPFFISAF